MVMIDEIFGGVRHPHYVNGRLLRASDLRADQIAARRDGGVEQAGVGEGEYQPVGAGAPVDGVVALAAVDDVGAAQPVDDVVAKSAREQVRPARARNQCHLMKTPPVQQLANHAREPLIHFA